MGDIFNKNGTEYICGLIKDGVKNKTNTATVRGNWEISEAILLPSDFTLILENCHLRMGDGTFDNIFRNEHCGDVLTTTAGKGNKNIKIIGKGEAILDGGKYNGLCEKNARTEGRPNMYVNNLLLFVNVEGFEIRNLHCRNQRWWALDFIFCSDGIIKDIDFLANDTCIDKKGCEYHGFTKERPEEVLVKNADGIDIRLGCHNIKIEDITGFTGDDTIALTGVLNGPDFAFKTEGKPIDICNIEIKNVRSAAYCSMVRLLSQGGVPLHDILVDGVYDVSDENECMDRGGCGVKIGEGSRLYGSRHSTEDETYNITVKNVRSRGKFGAIVLGGNMKDVVWENIEPFDGAEMLNDMRTL